MFGNLMTRESFTRCVELKEIKIEGSSDIDAKTLGSATYTLYCGSLLFEQVIDGQSQWIEHDLRHPYEIAPGEYVKIVSSQQLILNAGLFARFETPSTLIDLGLVLCAGKLDAGYGKEEERLIFGLMNARKVPVQLTRGVPVAHAMVFDCRGVMPDDDPSLTGYERHVRANRVLSRLRVASESIQDKLLEKDWVAEGESQADWR